MNILLPLKVLYKHGEVRHMVNKKQQEDDKHIGQQRENMFNNVKKKSMFKMKKIMFNSSSEDIYLTHIKDTVYFGICLHLCVAHLPSLYSSGLYPRCLTSVATPSASFPCQLGHVSGHRDLYLNTHKHK